MSIHPTCMRITAVIVLTLAAPWAVASVQTAAPAAARVGTGAILVTWEGDEPVDVFVAERPGLSPAQMRLISDDDRDGSHEYQSSSTGRPYFLLRWERGGKVRRVAERVLALENGSNFRDVGGYETADSRHVRWGRIYR